MHALIHILNASPKGSPEWQSECSYLSTVVFLTLNTLQFDLTDEMFEEFTCGFVLVACLATQMFVLHNLG